MEELCRGTPGGHGGFLRSGGSAASLCLFYGLKESLYIYIMFFLFFFFFCNCISVNLLFCFDLSPVEVKNPGLLFF